MHDLCCDLELCHDRVIAYLRQFELTGAVPPTASSAPTAMTTAEVLSAIQETKAEELARLKQAAFSRVVEWQREDGSWTDPNSNNPWDTSSTAWAARALLLEPDPRARLAAERGLAWLASSALPSGGLPTNRRCATANTYATAYTLRALAAAEGAPAVGAAIRYLQDTQNGDGGWGLAGAESSEPTLTAYVLHGLLDSGQQAVQSTIDRGLQYLRGSQTRPGVWPAWYEEAESVEGAAFCTYVLARGFALTRESLEGSIRYIVGRVENDDAWVFDGDAQPWIAVSVLLWAHQLMNHVLGIAP